MANRTDDDSLLVALYNARPETGRDTFPPTSLPAQALLNQVLSQPQAPRPADVRSASPRSISRRLAAGSLGAAALAAGVLGGLALADRPAARDSASTPVHAQTVATLRLAGYTFSLPAGFNTTAKPCGHAFTPPAGTTAVTVSAPPVVGGGSYTRAASADGGCVEAALGTGHPKNAQRVRVGSHPGFLWRTHNTIRGDLLTLYVELPPTASASVGMDPGLDLFLDSNNLTATQLVQIAKSGLGS